jgi:hypothetical protein
MLLSAPGTGLRAQTGEPRIWQGVYSEAQAARGRDHFNNVCIRCHGPELKGSTEAPALTGDRFYTTFEQEPIDRLFLKARDTMPPNFGVNVDEQGKLDITTYILKMNGYPSGPNELKLRSEDLATALILKKGEQPRVQNFSLVQTVGCLSQGANNTWMLTRTTDPVTTREDAATPQALEAAAKRPLGTRTFRLLNSAPFKPASHVGHKVDVRGLVYMDGSESKLTVTSLQMAASSCEG